MKMKWCFLLCTELVALCMVVLLSGCHSKEKVVYLQGADEVGQFENNASYEQKIAPDDELMILVTCEEEEMAVPFNRLVLSNAYDASSGAQVGANSYGTPETYPVYPSGMIEYPIVGKIEVAGMTRKELQLYLEKFMKEGEYMPDPTVYVDFVNPRYSVLGEVKSPGSFAMEQERVTIFDAIARAGDLTIYGERDKVRLIREENGEQQVHTLNLTDPQLLSSEYYYIRKNDALYVEGNHAKATDRNMNSLNSFTLTLTGFAITLAYFLKSL